MPVYTFRNKQTQEVFEKRMKIAEKEQYLVDHPDIESILLQPPGFGGVFEGAKKPDEGFKDVLRNIKQKAIGGKHLESRHI